MHFRTLATVQAPITIAEDKAKDLEIAAILAELKARKDAEKDNIMIGFYMEEFSDACGLLQCSLRYESGAVHRPVMQILSQKRFLYPKL